MYSEASSKMDVARGRKNLEERGRGKGRCEEGGSSQNTFMLLPVSVSSLSGKDRSDLESMLQNLLQLQSSSRQT